MIELKVMLIVLFALLVAAESGRYINICGEVRKYAANVLNFERSAGRLSSLSNVVLVQTDMYIQFSGSFKAAQLSWAIPLINCYIMMVI